MAKRFIISVLLLIAALFSANAQSVGSNGNLTNAEKIALYKTTMLEGDYQNQFDALQKLLDLDENIGRDPNAYKYPERLYQLAKSGKAAELVNDEFTLYFYLFEYYKRVANSERAFESLKMCYDYKEKYHIEADNVDHVLIITGADLPKYARFVADLGEKLVAENRLPKSKEDRSTILSFISIAYSTLGDKEKSQKYEKMSYDQDPMMAASSLMIKYLNNKDWDNLIKVCNTILQDKNVSSEDRGQALRHLLTALLFDKKPALLEKYSRSFFENIRDEIITQMPLMTIEEQQKYVANGPLLDELMYDVFIYMQSNNLIWADASSLYDYALLYKGVLLSNYKNLDRLLANSSDKTIREKWVRLKALEKSSSDNDFYEKESLRRTLIDYASRQSDYIAKFKYTWRDVQKALKPGEVAVEWIFTPCGGETYSDFSLPRYFALVIKPGMKEPAVVPVLHRYELTSFIRDAQEPSALYDPVLDDPGSKKGLIADLTYMGLWGELNEYLKDCKTVYFSPAEQLHTIAMEQLWSIKPACEKWNLYRVSSTREIIGRKKKSSLSNIVMFGDLDYEMAETGPTMPKEGQRSLFVSRATRSACSPLPASAEELSTIKRFAKGVPSVSIKSFTGKNGTEAQFYALSGSKVDIFHLATHGFFFERSAFADKSSFMNAGQSEYDAMYQSGLMLSGANRTLRGKVIPYNEEDGILTAEEISQTDLNSVDLVVLSACESAQGEVKSDGVFGLQRGFKKAGCQSLLMSLWEADDKATSLLMSKFYELYLSGKHTKIESLRMAQEYVKKYSPVYANPYYWAGWILLDALN